MTFQPCCHALHKHAPLLSPVARGTWCRSEPSAWGKHCRSLQAPLTLILQDLEPLDKQSCSHQVSLSCFQQREQPIFQSRFRGNKDTERLHGQYRFAKLLIARSQDTALGKNHSILPHFCIISKASTTGICVRHNSQSEVPSV